MDNEIFTSYYARTKNFYVNRWHFVQVSHTYPNWWPIEGIIKLNEVVPPWYLVEGIKKGLLTEEYYTESYKNFLSQVDREAVLEKLYGLLKDKNVVLLCYERPTDFCHRHILASWLSPELEVKELESNYYESC